MELAVPDTIKRLARNHTVRAIIGVLLVVAVVALGIITVYFVGPNGFPTVHQHRVFKPETAVTRTPS
ncbi:MAG: hypothetical protein NVS4B6_24700 [Mycobacterium sp.]